MDRENVISDLQEQIDWIRNNEFHKFPGWGHTVLAMKDALELLKEQEHKDKMFHALEEDWKRLKDLLKEQEAKYPACEKCGKEIDHINTSVFNYDGSDSDYSIPITYSKENGCVSFSTSQKWTGYDLTDEEQKERIRCPYCGKFPFDDGIEIEFYEPVEVMMWTSEGR